MVTKFDLLIEVGVGKCGLFMVSVLDSAGSSQGVSPSIVLCCWERYFTLTVPLSTQMFKWVLANLKLGSNHLMNLASHPGGVEILLFMSLIRLIFKMSSVTPDFFYVFNLIISFSIYI